MVLCLISFSPVCVFMGGVNFLIQIHPFSLFLDVCRLFCTLHKVLWIKLTVTFFEPEVIIFQTLVSWTCEWNSLRAVSGFRFLAHCVKPGRWSIHYLRRVAGIQNWDSFPKLINDCPPGLHFCVLTCLVGRVYQAFQQNYSWDVIGSCFLL